MTIELQKLVPASRLLVIHAELAKVEDSNVEGTSMTPSAMLTSPLQRERRACNRSRNCGCRPTLRHCEGG